MFRMKDRKKTIKWILMFVLEYIVIFVGLIVLITIQRTGVNNMKVYSQFLPKHMELQEILEKKNGYVAQGGLCVTGDNNSWFSIRVEAGKLLDMKMDYVTGGSYAGYLWQSEDDIFDEDPEMFVYYSGHNLIQINPDTQYIQIMISNQPGVEYQISDFSYQNPFLIYANLSKRFLLFLTTILWFIGVGMHFVSRLNNVKLRKQCLFWGYLAVIFLTAFAIFQDYLFGNKIFAYLDIGSDTILQYYPYYLNCARRIRDGVFGTWNWEYGLGTSLLNNYTLTWDPFGLFVIFGGVIGGLDKIRRLLIIAQILKVLISAILCRYYLKLFQLSDKAVYIGSYLYAFNGYLMLWGQHYMLGTICIYLLLILIFIEKILREQKTIHIWGLSVSVAASLFYSCYTTYMVLIFALIYGVLRLLNPNMGMAWKSKIKKAGICIVAVIIGLLMSSATLLPWAEYQLRSSSRLDSETSILTRLFSAFFSHYSQQETFQTIGRLMSNNLFYINRFDAPGWPNYYEMPNLCMSIFIYIFLIQFLIQSIRECRGKRQFFYGTIVAVVSFLILFNPGIALIFNGFAAIVARYTFVVMPVAALLIAVEWERLIEKKELSRVGLLLGIFISILILYLAYRTATVEVRNYNVVVAILIVFFAGLLLLISGKKARPRRWIYTAVLCIVLSTIWECNITNNNRAAQSADAEGFVYENGKIVNDTMAALEYLKESDDSFYRVEKTYVDQTIYGDPLLEGYSSITEYNSTLNRNLKDFMEQLYSNVIVVGQLRQFNYNDSSEINNMNLINLKYILTKDKRELLGFEYVDQIGSVYVYRNRTAHSIASFYTKSISKNECAEMPEVDRRKLLQDTVIVEDENDIYREEMKSNTKVSAFKVKKDSVSGTVSNMQKGVLVITIPDQNGWTVYVDGQRVNTFNADYGFLGVELEPGDHDIIAQYQIPYLKAGIVCSSLGVLLLVIFCVLHRRKEVKAWH